MYSNGSLFTNMTLWAKVNARYNTDNNTELNHIKYNLRSNSSRVNYCHNLRDIINNTAGLQVYYDKIL